MPRFAIPALLLLLIPAGLAAQTVSSDRSVTVTASRSVNVPPDQAIFGLQVNSPTGAASTDVLSALQGLGLTTASFSSVATVSQYDLPGRIGTQSLSWSFNVTVPLAAMKSTLDQLAGAQVAMAKQGNGLSLSYSLRGTQTSPQALAGQNCSAADLIADARSQAQKIAVAAGLSVGGVLSVSGTSIVTPPSGSFSSGTYQPSCTIMVKFALTGV